MSYELKKSPGGEFSFNLRASNGEVILTSQMYAAKASALAGIESVRANGPKDEAYEIQTASNGKPYFVLKAANTQVIGRSQLYSTEAAAKSGMEAVKKNSTSTVVKAAE